MRPAVSYIPYTTYSKVQTGDIIMFAQFEEGVLLPETRDTTESGAESDDNLIIPPLIAKKKWM